MHLRKSFLALAVLLPALVVSSASRAADPAPTRIGVVNIVKLFNSLDAKMAGDAEIENLGKNLNAQRQELEDELNRLKQELTQYKVDSDIYKETSEKLLKKGMELQSFSQYMEQKILLETRIRTAALYRAMNNAIADYAKSQGFGLVLASDDPDLSQARTQAELLSKITIRKVIYAHDSLDITKAIVDKMNSENKTAPTTSPK